jgi:hypothetical protein
VDTSCPCTSHKQLLLYLWRPLFPLLPQYLHQALLRFPLPRRPQLRRQFEVRRNLCSRADCHSRSCTLSNSLRSARSGQTRRTFRPPDRSRGCSCKQIGPTQIVVQSDGFASAFADLEGLEPVASALSLGSDPRGEFWLKCRRGQVAVLCRRL